MIGPSKQNVHEPSAFCLSLNSVMVFFLKTPHFLLKCAHHAQLLQKHIYSASFTAITERKKLLAGSSFLNIHVSLQGLPIHF